MPNVAFTDPNPVALKLVLPVIANVPADAVYTILRPHVENAMPPAVILEFTVISSELTDPPLRTKPVVPRLPPLAVVPIVTLTEPMSLWVMLPEPVTVNWSPVDV